MLSTMVLALSWTLAVSSSALSAESRQAKRPTGGLGPLAFERLEFLLGEWRGTHQWSGAIQSDAGPVVATYALTGNGSAIIENLGDGKAIWMTTVYYVEGEELVANHYCTHNQPRLRASGLEGESLRFELTDISNLDTLDEGHVHRIELLSREAKRLSLVFHYLAGSDRSRWSLDLTRVSGDP